MDDQLVVVHGIAKMLHGVHGSRLILRLVLARLIVHSPLGCGPHHQLGYPLPAPHICGWFWLASRQLTGPVPALHPTGAF